MHDCDKCENKICRACDKPFDNYSDLGFFEHVICLLAALIIVSIVWLIIWFLYD